MCLHSLFMLAIFSHYEAGLEWALDEQKAEYLHLTMFIEVYKAMVLLTERQWLEECRLLAWIIWRIKNTIV
jgi:hypothetical protein